MIIFTYCTIKLDGLDKIIYLCYVFCLKQLYICLLNFQKYFSKFMTIRLSLRRHSKNIFYHDNEKQFYSAKEIAMENSAIWITFMKN